MKLAAEIEAELSGWWGTADLTCEWTRCLWLAGRRWRGSCTGEFLTVRYEQFFGFFLVGTEAGPQRVRGTGINNCMVALWKLLCHAIESVAVSRQWGKNKQTMHHPLFVCHHTLWFRPHRGWWVWSGRKAKESAWMWCSRTSWCLDKRDWAVLTGRFALVRWRLWERSVCAGAFAQHCSQNKKWNRYSNGVMEPCNVNVLFALGQLC